MLLATWVDIIFKTQETSLVKFWDSSIGTKVAISTPFWIYKCKNLSFLKKKKKNRFENNPIKKNI